MRKFLPLALAMTMSVAACTEGNDSADVGDRTRVEPRGLDARYFPPPNTPLVVETVAGGSGGAFLPPSGDLVENPTEWRELWDRLQPADGNRPDIDFANNKLLVIGRSLPSAGHALSTSSIMSDNDKIDVTLTIVEPGAGCASASVIKETWVAVRVPFWVSGADLTEQRTTGPACG